ncbi:MAG TPA: methyl-accepting chemotaxis protein [Myxococcota bacterium]|nr:methyl-accepting chemotaxis protein [Myxococcota bacterium]
MDRGDGGPDLETDAGALWRAIRWTVIGTVVVSQVLVMLYTCVTLQTSVHYWIFGLRFTAVTSAITSLALLALARRAMAPVRSYSEATARGIATMDEAREAYRAAIDLPRRIFLWGGPGCGVVIAVLAGVALVFLIPGIAISTVITIGISMIGTGSLANLFAFSALKRRLEPCAVRIGDAIPDLGERARLVRTLSVRTKLLVAVLTVLAVSVAFVSSMAGTGASLQLKRVVSLLQERVLANAAKVESEGEAALYLAKNEANLQAMPMSLYLVDTKKAEALVDDEDNPLTPLDLDAIQLETQTGDQGTLAGSGATIVSWQRVADGTLLVARTYRSAITEKSGSVDLPLFGAFFVSILVAAFVALLLAREVSDPLTRMRRSVEQIATGDLRADVRVESEDEIGDLARSFSHMTRALRETIHAVSSASERVEKGAAAVATGAGEVRHVTEAQEEAVAGMARSVGGVTRQADDIASAAEALHGAVAESSASVTQLAALGADLQSAASMLSQQTDDVSTSIERLARGIREVAENAAGLASTTHDTATAMEQMARSMSEVESGASECAALSDTAVRSAESGQERVAQAVRCMDEIREATSTAEGVIDELGDRAKKIGHVVDVIDDVADETTLLALNAAIIAAQAGEHGRGFAVVAQQIKELATRVLASTKEIAELVAGVQEGSERARQAIDRGAQVVERGVSLSAEAGRSLDDIARASAQAGQRVAAIVQAVQEQATAARHVASLTERVSQGVAQIRESGREQQQANQAVLRGAANTRDAAASVSASASQQAEGSSRIRASVESLRDAAERIERALQSQSTACREAESLLSAVTDGARANGESAESMAEAMRGLAREADAMRDAVRRFRV